MKKPEPKFTEKRIRELLAAAAPGAAELHESLRPIFQLPEHPIRLDSTRVKKG